jgi:hypothetical protein
MASRRISPTPIRRLYHRLHGVRVRLFSCTEAQGLLSGAGLRVSGQRRDCWLSTVIVAGRENDGSSG